MTRGIKILLVFVVFICGELLVTMSGSAENSSGGYEIHVSDIKICSAKFKPGDKLKISMRVTNSGSKKLNRIGIVFSAPSAQSYYLKLRQHKKGKLWTGSFKVEKGMEKGLWRIWNICFSTVPGEDGYRIYNRFFSRGRYRETNMSKGNFRIYKTKGDYNKPKIHFDTLNVFQKAAPGKSGSYITYRVKVTDQSSIADVIIALAELKSGGWKNPWLIHTDIRLRYNKNTGYYEKTLWEPKGTYILHDIFVRDIFGNSGMYFNTECDKYCTFRKAYYSRIDLSKFRMKVV